MMSPARALAGLSRLRFASTSGGEMPDTDLSAVPKDISLRALVEKKLTAGRYQDLADVVALIRTHELDESFQDHLSAPLREAYRSCIEEIRRDEAWELLCDREAEEIIRPGDERGT
jgi:hypothetical protein